MKVARIVVYRNFCWSTLELMCIYGYMCGYVCWCGWVCMLVWVGVYVGVGGCVCIHTWCYGYVYLYVFIYICVFIYVCVCYMCYWNMFSENRLIYCLHIQSYTIRLYIVCAYIIPRVFISR